MSAPESPPFLWLGWKDSPSMPFAGSDFDLSRSVWEVVKGTDGWDSGFALSPFWFVPGSSVVFVGLESSIFWFRYISVSGRSVDGVGVGFLENLS